MELTPMNKLTPAEYRYMRIIWEHPEGITSNELYKPYDLTMGAQSTILRKVVRKGYATSKQVGKQVYYYPVGTRLEYDRIIVEDDLKMKMGFSSLGSLIASFCGRDKLKKDEQEKLDSLISELEKQADDD